MADEPWLLKEDGFLNVDVEARHIVYHSSLNVILVFSQLNEVKVLDINSGIVLQSCQLPGNTFRSFDLSIISDAPRFD